MIMLRPLKEKDVEGILEWMHDPDFQQSFRMDTLSKKYEDIVLFIQDAVTELVDGANIHYAIADEHDEYLGTISLKNIDMDAKNAEYAICLRKKAQGKGIASQATRKLLKIAFMQFRLERIYLNVLSDNENAIHLYEKCGFSYEGEFRKHLFLRGEYRNLKWYSILKEEYYEGQNDGLYNAK